jgi:hypothetical protein
MFVFHPTRFWFLVVLMDFEIKTLRVIFRFLFVSPLVILGIDGVRPHQHINESM